MNNAEFLLTQLAGLRHQLMGVVAAIDLIMEHASRPSDQATAPGLPVCRHPLPRRVPTPAMGHPRRFRCGDCNEEVEE
jgi:hypothetical protein